MYLQGSAFRCLKTGDPIDAVLDRAARESGVPITDILENLPAELSVWIDPGEVSYRIGEKGAVKVSTYCSLQNALNSAYALVSYFLDELHWIIAIIHGMVHFSSIFL